MGIIDQRTAKKPLIEATDEDRQRLDLWHANSRAIDVTLGLMRRFDGLPKAVEREALDLVTSRLITERELRRQAQEDVEAGVKRLEAELERDLEELFTRTGYRTAGVAPIANGIGRNGSGNGKVKS
jgi:hypothetical protein